MEPEANHFPSPLYHHSTILSDLGLPFTHGFVFGNSRATSQWVTHPGSALASFSLNFRVPIEPKASELPKDLVLGRDENIHLRITPLGDVGCHSPHTKQVALVMNTGSGIHQLKEVSIENSYVSNEIEFARYILERAQNLKKMVIVHRDDDAPSKVAGMMSRSKMISTASVLIRQDPHQIYKFRGQGSCDSYWGPDILKSGMVTLRSSIATQSSKF
ncbi:hypothetical protein ACFX15_032199 [Malus domestica]